MIITASEGVIRQMQPTIAEEILGLVFEVGQAMGIVSPAIRTTVKKADALALSLGVSEAQRFAAGRVAASGRTLGALQAFKAATE